MSTEELAGSLSDGISDLRAIASQPPALVRPPYWTYDRDTLSAYRRAGLAMLLTDVLARDGGPTLFQANPDRGSWILLTGLIKVREHLARRHLPQVGDAVPVVMTFHDTNRYTSEHLSEYLSTLIQQAREAGLRVANPPFYSDRAALIQAARARAELGIF
jgi:peptidoglycan/xylan/chitin deacetylase (PgdA/CDA1 family)